MSLRHVLGVVVVGWIVFIPISPVLAQGPNPVGIGDVTVIPEGIITPADAVSLDVRLVSGSCCIGLFEPTQVQVVGNEIFVDIFAGSGLLAIPDGRLESIPLGTFSLGTYFYEVTQNGPTFPPQVSQVSGSFQVVPEPATAAMIVAGIPLLLHGLNSRNGRRGRS